MTETEAVEAAEQDRVGIDWRHGALAGVAAAAVALGVAELIGLVTGPRSTPMVAVGGLIIDRVPEAGKELAIDLFGTRDKQALLVIMGVLLAAFAAELGVVARRRPWIGYAGIAAFGALAVVAAATRADADALDALPALIGTAAGAVTLWFLLGLAPAEADPAGRRTFLRWVGAAVGGAAVVGLAGRSLGLRRNVDNARKAVVLPTPSSSAPAAPPGADLGLPDLAPYTTPNQDFYRIDTAIVVPQVDPAGWRLKIHGRVRNPITLTFDDLLRRPTIERYVTLACVSNEVGGDLIGNALWLGVPVKELLDEADPEPGADQVVSRSVDGFTAGTPTAVLRDGRDAMIGIAMNGEPLPIDHGFPARMVVPGLYGYVSATKWLTELELTSFDDFDAYWIPRGWARRAPIKTQSRIDTPRFGTAKAAGTITVAGVAWAQHRGISTVEVRVDGGAWQKATLAATASIDTWRQWRWSWAAKPGTHTLQVRAADNSGDFQPETEAPPLPDGATGYHTIEVNVA